jgi:DNA-binding MarR family transcriptional regulator
MHASESIFFLLAKADQAASRFWKARLAPLGVTTTQALVLAFLQAEDHIRAASLGQRLLLDSATLTGVLRRLEARGLVARRKDTEDRRSSGVCLTPSGRALGMRIAADMQQAEAVFIERLTVGENNQLRAALAKLPP